MKSSINILDLVGSNFNSFYLIMSIISSAFIVHESRLRISDFIISGEISWISGVSFIMIQRFK